MSKKRDWNFSKVYPYLLIVLAGIGLIAATVLAAEEYHLLKNPSAPLACDINPLISCGAIMKTAESSVFFGIPNPLWGIPAFAGLITIGVMLALGAKPKQRWFWQGLQLGITLGIGFIFWLMYHSIFVLKTLCPWCMVTWSAMIPLFFYTTLYNFEQGHLIVKGGVAQVYKLIRREHLLVLFAIFAVIIWVILYKFWYYWSTLL